MTCRSQLLFCQPAHAFGPGETQRAARDAGRDVNAPRREERQVEVGEGVGGGVVVLRLVEGAQGIIARLERALYAAKRRLREVDDLVVVFAVLYACREPAPAGGR